VVGAILKQEELAFIKAMSNLELYQPLREIVSVSAIPIQFKGSVIDPSDVITAEMAEQA
jgi:hypothetical protein